MDINMEYSMTSTKPKKVTYQNTLTEIELNIENTLEFIQNELPLTEILLTDYLPILIGESTHQLQLVLNETEHDFLPTHSPRTSKDITNNFFIETIRYQINYLKKANPLALLIWA